MSDWKIRPVPEGLMVQDEGGRAYRVVLIAVQAGQEPEAWKTRLLLAAPEKALALMGDSDDAKWVDLDPDLYYLFMGG